MHAYEENILMLKFTYNTEKCITLSIRLIRFSVDYIFILVIFDELPGIA